MTMPTDPLRAEHRDLFPHVAELRTIADGVTRWDADTSGRIADVVGFLSQHLVAHAHAEEEVLYPAVEDLLEAPGATATMVADHVEIVARLDRLQTIGRSLAPGSPTEDEANELRAELYGLWAILGLHFRKEEEVLLPILDAHLDDDEALALFDRMGAAAHPGGPAA